MFVCCGGRNIYIYIFLFFVPPHDQINPDVSKVMATMGQKRPSLNADGENAKAFPPFTFSA